MTIGLLFWFLMILTLIFGWFIYPPTSAPNYRPFGYSLLLWVLLALLGIAAFGWPIKG